MQSLLDDTAYWAGEDFPTDSFAGHGRTGDSHEPEVQSKMFGPGSDPLLNLAPPRSVYLDKSYRVAVYFDDTVETDEYAPAFQYGLECHRRFAADAAFESAEPELCRDYAANRDITRSTSVLAGTAAGLLDWQRARYAVRDGWNHACGCA